MIGLRASTAFACVALVGCSPAPLPPLGQLRLGVDTDAPLPPRMGEIEGIQPALFDRLRIELFSPSATEPCDDCVREFGVDEGMVLDGRATMGIVPKAGEQGVRARVRLYRSGGSDVVEPRPTSTLEAVLDLPSIGEEGIVDVHTTLLTQSLGSPNGTLDMPVPADSGPAPGHLAGTWEADHHAECSGGAQDEVCIRGGAYWMGDLTIGQGYGSVPSERLVVVSSFYIDASEVTVAAFRAAKVGGNVVFDHASHPECNYTAQPSSFDSYPVNCVTKAGAEAYCKTKGARLPTEAEWEFVASGRRGSHASWGDDPPACGDAIFARSANPGATDASKECTSLGTGPQPIGSGALDRFTLPGGTVVDLAGNLTEWMADAWAKEGSSCWSGPLLYDPFCATSPGANAYVVRGASFDHPRSSIRAALRASISASGAPVSAEIGFRCAR